MAESLEAQLRATLNMIPAYTWYATRSGGLIFVNERAADYGGLPSDHPLRHGTDTSPAWDSHIPFLHPEDQEETRRVWSECLRTGHAGEMSFRARNAEGGYRWFLSRAEPLRSNDGTILNWIGINLDIEERKQAEVALRRSKEYLADAERLSRTGFVAMEGSTKRLFWSEEAARIYGYAPGTEPTPDLILQRSHPDDVGLVRDALERAADDGRDFDYEHRLLMSDGSIKFLHDIAHRVRDEGGNHEVIGAIIDITERKVAERAFRRSEAYLTEAQTLSHTGSFGWKPDTGEIVWSDETYRIFEYGPAETPHLDMVLERIHPQDRALAQQILESASTTGSHVEHECRLLMPSGAIKDVHVRAQALQDSSGNIELVGAVTDITERKTVEEQIRQQEVELRQILDATPHVIAVYGPNRERLYVNRIALDYLGLAREDWQQTLERFAFVHPDDRARERDYFDRARSTGSAYENELRLRKGDGSYRWFLARYNPVLDIKGHVVRWYVACNDIDDRKKAEGRLQQKTSPYAKKSPQPRCSKRLLGRLPLYNRCFLSSPRSRQVIRRFS